MNGDTPGTPDLRWEGGSPDGLGGKEWTTTRPEVATPDPLATAWPTKAERDELRSTVYTVPRHDGPIIARQVAAREAAAYARGRDEALVCDCYPDGVSPEMYEGPQEWCDVHGQTRRVLIQHRDAARALVDTLRAEVAKAEQRGAARVRAELADRYVDQLRRQENVHDACEGHALCDLVAELTHAAAVAES